jgi:hypothetical protein
MHNILFLDIFLVLILPLRVIYLMLMITSLCYSVLLYLLLFPRLHLSRSGHLDFAPLNVLYLIFLLSHALLLSQKISLLLLLDGVAPHLRYLVESSQYLYHNVLVH